MLCMCALHMLRTTPQNPAHALPCSYGAIVTRLQSIEEMAGMNMLCSDKTGEPVGSCLWHTSSAVWAWATCCHFALCHCWPRPLPPPGQAP
jgi:hypothetical protein